MKSYTIGRVPTCNIVIDDPQKVISRNHAVININDRGEIQIVDLSANGTYINGMRIAANVPVPVTRKDKVSFAHVADLDWSKIPDPTKKTKLLVYCIAGVVLLAVIAAVLFFMFKGHSGASSSNTDSVPAAVGTAVEDIKVGSTQPKTDLDSLNKALDAQIAEQDRKKALEEEKKRKEKERAEKAAKGSKGANNTYDEEYEEYEVEQQTVEITTPAPAPKRNTKPNTAPTTTPNAVPDF